VEEQVTNAVTEPASGATVVNVDEVRRRDWVGSIVGLGVFLLGIGLLVIVFQVARELFSRTPSQAVFVTPGKPLDMAKATNSVTTLVIQIITMLIMAIFGSVVANKGISLYSKSILR
jgi:hypothetical protein